jgi:hypothetical protein
VIKSCWGCVDSIDIGNESVGLECEESRARAEEEEGFESSAVFTNVCTLFFAKRCCCVPVQCVLTTRHTIRVDDECLQGRAVFTLGAYRPRLPEMFAFSLTHVLMWLGCSLFHKLWRSFAVLHNIDKWSDDSCCIWRIPDCTNVLLITTPPHLTCLF